MLLDLIQISYLRPNSNIRLTFSVKLQYFPSSASLRERLRDLLTKNRVYLNSSLVHETKYRKIGVKRSIYKRLLVIHVYSIFLKKSVCDEMKKSHLRPYLPGFIVSRNIWPGLCQGNIWTPAFVSIQYKSTYMGYIQAGTICGTFMETDCEFCAQNSSTTFTCQSVCSSPSVTFLFHIQTLSSRNLCQSTQYTEHWTGSPRGPF